MPKVYPPLVLASASPRRRDLLGYLGVQFTALATDAEEQDITPPPEFSARMPIVPVVPHFHPTMLAWRKAFAACEITTDSVIIGADTIVVIDGDVLNKPVNSDQAHVMLRRLAGRVHSVYTGVVIISQTANIIQCAVEHSQVEIATIDDETIGAYVATGEPLDKAGAYGIQGLGGRLVRAVQGSYTNVVGLPLTLIHRLLNEVGFHDLVSPFEAYHHWLAVQGKEPLPCPPTLP